MDENAVSLLKKEVDNSLRIIRRTRSNRINLSERLKKYSNRWKVITFILNIEAVFLIIWALYSDMNTDTPNIAIPSAFFAIYVILLQYFINEQNFNERSIKSHYHQLELRDLIIKLDVIKIKICELQKNRELSNEEKIQSQEYNLCFNKYEEVMKKYQLVLKNNENHSKRDDLSTQVRQEVKGFLLYDISFENIFILINFVISIVMFIYIGALFK